MGGIGKALLTEVVAYVLEQMVDFPDRPDFAGGYMLSAPDEAPARRVFTAPLRDWIVKIRREPGMNQLQITGGRDASRVPHCRA